MRISRARGRAGVEYAALERGDGVRILPALEKIGVGPADDLVRVEAEPRILHPDVAKVAILFPDVHRRGAQSRRQPLVGDPLAFFRHRPFDRFPGPLDRRLDQREFVDRPPVRRAMVHDENGRRAARLEQRRDDIRANLQRCGRLALGRRHPRIVGQVVDDQRPPGAELGRNARTVAAQMMLAGEAGDAVAIVFPYDAPGAVVAQLAVLHARRLEPHAENPRRRPLDGERIGERTQRVAELQEERLARFARGERRLGRPAIIDVDDRSEVAEEDAAVIEAGRADGERPAIGAVGPPHSEFDSEGLRASTAERSVSTVFCRSSGCRTPSQPQPSASARDWPVRPRQRSSIWVQRPLASLVELMTQNGSASLCIRNLVPRCGRPRTPFRRLGRECHGFASCFVDRAKANGGAIRKEMDRNSSR